MATFIINVRQLLPFTAYYGAVLVLPRVCVCVCVTPQFIVVVPIRTDTHEMLYKANCHTCNTPFELNACSA